jgi:3-mercaptopyruvate sulfurtransferase SseA
MKVGIDKVRPLHGGLEAWISAGYAVESPETGAVLEPLQVAARLGAVVR